MAFIIVYVETPRWRGCAGLNLSLFLTRIRSAMVLCQHDCINALNPVEALTSLSTIKRFIAICGLILHASVLIVLDWLWEQHPCSSDTFSSQVNLQSATNRHRVRQAGMIAVPRTRNALCPLSRPFMISRMFQESGSFPALWLARIPDALFPLDPSEPVSSETACAPHAFGTA